MKVFILILPTVLLLGFAAILSQAALGPPKSTVQNIPQTRAEFNRLSAELDSMEGEAHHVIPRGGLSN